ncbi:MAG: hypothetical protein ACOYEV_10745 [Candidatus Nanopelagicales bacterium]
MAQQRPAEAVPGDLVFAATGPWWFPAGGVGTSLAGVLLREVRAEVPTVDDLPRAADAYLFDTVLPDGTAVTFAADCRDSDFLADCLLELDGEPAVPGVLPPRSPGTVRGAPAVGVRVGCRRPGCHRIGRGDPEWGEMVQATVVSTHASPNGPVGVVTWEGPWNGTRRLDTVAAVATARPDPVGAQVPVQVVPGPLASQAWHPDSLPGFVGFVALVLAGTAFVGFALDIRDESRERRGNTGAAANL